MIIANDGPPGPVQIASRSIVLRFIPPVGKNRREPPATRQRAIVRTGGRFTSNRPGLVGTAPVGTRTPGGVRGQQVTSFCRVSLFHFAGCYL